MTYYDIPIRMAKIKLLTVPKCCWWHGAAGSQEYCWWEDRMVKAPGKTVSYRSKHATRPSNFPPWYLSYINVN